MFQRAVERQNSANSLILANILDDVYQRYHTLGDLNQSLRDAFVPQLRKGLHGLDGTSLRWLYNNASNYASNQILVKEKLELYSNLPKETIYLVSAHIDARPSHYLWQGKEYTMDGLINICGLGSMLGLLGINCRHSFYVKTPGDSEPFYESEANEIAYKKRQREMTVRRTYDMWNQRHMLEKQLDPNSDACRLASQKRKFWNQELKKSRAE